MNLYKLYIGIFILLLSINTSAQNYAITEGDGEVIAISASLPFMDGPTDLPVVENNGNYFFQGCIKINAGGRGGAMTNDDDLLWPNSIVPYTVSPSHPLIDDINWAINELNRQTNVCIRPRTNEENYIRIRSDDDGCWSELGMIGGRQDLNLSVNETRTRGCFDGVVIHEFMHAIGIFHEQARDDRDDHVEILEDNIRDGYVSQFDPMNDWWDNLFSRNGDDRGSYDFGSIMHYGPNDFGKPDASGNPKQTIRALRAGVTFGQRDNLSPGDIATINALYPNAASGCATSSSSSSETTNSNDFLSEYWNQSWPSQGRGGAGESSINVHYEVELVPQQTGMSCWAAAAAMIVGWADQVCIDPSEIANAVGYWSQYQQGLKADDTTVFNHWGLAHEPPMSYQPRDFVNLLAGYGPLWIATHEGGPHARVVTGASGDGTPQGTILTIYDPWQRGMRRFRSNNTGAVYTESYEEFERKNHELAELEMNVAAPIYIAHN